MLKGEGMELRQVGTVHVSRLDQVFDSKEQMKWNLLTH